jgi:peptidoglycan/LPS O-acetylase OafA/YrhL
MRLGFIPFMRAHGQRPGPGQRPKTAGALAGGAAGVLAIPVLELSGAPDSVGVALRGGDWLIPFVYVCVAVLAGLVYGGLFQRAAADRRGGWLFGVSYGFLLWMLGPITLLQMFLGRPLATGTAAMGVLAANLMSGLVLGLLFRPAHVVVQRVLKHRIPGASRDVTRRPAEELYGR